MQEPSSWSWGAGGDACAVSGAGIGVPAACFMENDGGEQSLVYVDPWIDADMVITDYCGARAEHESWNLDGTPWSDGGYGSYALFEVGYGDSAGGDRDDGGQCWQSPAAEDGPRAADRQRRMEAPKQRGSASWSTTTKSHIYVPKRVDFKKEFQKQGDECVITTVMIRNIPNQYHRHTLMLELDTSGFQGKYNFLYLPIDMATRMNVGYAFVNFISPDDALACMESMDGYMFTYFRRNCKRPAQVSVAHIQGLEQNLAHWEGTSTSQAAVYWLRPWVRDPDTADSGAPVEALSPREETTTTAVNERTVDAVDHWAQSGSDDAATFSQGGPRRRSEPLACGDEVLDLRITSKPNEALLLAIARRLTSHRIARVRILPEAGHSFCLTSFIAAVRGIPAFADTELEVPQPRGTHHVAGKPAELERLLNQGVLEDSAPADDVVEPQHRAHTSKKGRRRARCRSSKQSQIADDASLCTDRGSLPITTLEIRSLPSNYTQNILVEELEQLGLQSSINFISVPCSPNATDESCNAGYALANFWTAELCSHALEMLQGYEWQGASYDSGLFAEVTHSAIQGLEANVNHALGIDVDGFFTCLPEAGPTEPTTADSSAISTTEGGANDSCPSVRSFGSNHDDDQWAQRPMGVSEPRCHASSCTEQARRGRAARYRVDDGGIRLGVSRTPSPSPEPRYRIDEGGVLVDMFQAPSPSVEMRYAAWPLLVSFEEVPMPGATATRRVRSKSL